MEEQEINDLKNKALEYLKRRISGELLETIHSYLHLENVPLPVFRVYMDELHSKGLLSRVGISGNRRIYRITEDGRNFLENGGYKSDKKQVRSEKKVLFISYANENYKDKVFHIKRLLKAHPLFEALVIEDKEKPNQDLGKLIKEGIEASDFVIPILSPESYRKQWINQEIGYAEGRKPIIPIIEKGILKDLSGFVNDQRQCPYCYTARDLQHRREENKSFMRKFRSLIMNLEEEVRKTANKSTIHRTIYYHKPLGTICITGEECPEGGVWETEFEPKQVMTIPKGTKMPPLQGSKVKWRLIEYRDNLNIIPNG